MTGQRLSLALSGAGLALPEGRIAVFHPGAGADLSDLPRDRVKVITGFRPDYEHFEAAGFDCATAPEGEYSAALVCLSRARKRSQADIAMAAGVAPLVIVDGAKTDGVDAILRACRDRMPVEGPINKAHGKLFWFAGGDAFADWAEGVAHEIVPGFVTRPGVFSADGIDPASEALAAVLPVKLGREVADLGAGWGYLAARVLERAGVERVHLVESEHTALDCARRNVTDTRAEFHWADARHWTPESGLDAVIMNPPFHTTRDADPSLGRDFIRAAARVLKPGGSLWMVANRHLPYESTLAECFGDITALPGDNRFKLVHARRPSRHRR